MAEEVKITAKVETQQATKGLDEISKSFSATQANLNKIGRDLYEIGEKINKSAIEPLKDFGQQIERELKNSTDLNKTFDKLKEGIERVGEAARTAGKDEEVLRLQMEAMQKVAASLNLRGITSNTDNAGSNLVFAFQRNLERTFNWGEDQKALLDGMENLRKSKEAISEEDKKILENMDAQKQIAEEEVRLYEEQAELEKSWVEAKAIRLAEINANEVKAQEEATRLASERAAQEEASYDEQIKRWEDEAQLESDIATSKRIHLAEVAEQNRKTQEEALRLVEEKRSAEERAYDELIVQWEKEAEIKLRIQEMDRAKEIAENEQLVDELDRLAEASERYSRARAEAAAATEAEARHQQKQAMYDNLFGEKKLSGISAGLSQFASKLGKTIYQITVFRTVMNITNGIIRGFNRLLSDSVSIAAESEQVYSKLTTVFGEYSNALQKANELASSIGVSSQTAASALSTVGDLLQAQGAGTVESLQLASDWVEKFQDIIAFKDINMSLEEFAQNFMSGAAGNLRNFRTFGSIVKESAVQARLMADGLDQLTGSDLELAKMTARAEIALEQQANAIGATEREWDTMLSVSRRYNEAIKEMEENIGNALIPWVKDLKSTVADVVKGWNDAIAARNAYRNGELDYNSGKNVKTDVNTYSSFYDSLQYAMGSLYGKKDKVGSVLLEYGADIYDVNRALEEMAANGIIVNKKGAELAKEFALQRGEASALSSQYETLKAELEAYGQSVDSVMERIQSVDGVNFVGSTWYTNLEKALELDFEKLKDSEAVKGKLTGLGLTYGGVLSDAVTEAVSDIGTAKFGSNADYKFGKADTWTDLEKQVTAYEALYQILSTIDGVSEGMLQLVVSGWDKATEALKKHNDELELTKKYESALASLNGYGYGDKLAAAQLADNKMANEGMSEQKANAYATMYQQWQTAYDLAKKTGQDVSVVNTAFAKAWEDASKYFSYIEEKERKAQRAADYSSALSSLQGSGSNLAVLRTTQAYMNAGYTSDYASALANYQSNVAAANSTYEQGILNATTSEEMETVKKAWEDACEQMSMEFQDQTKDMYKTVAEETLAGIKEIWQGVADNFVSMWGEGGTLYKAFANIGSGDATKKATGWSSLADFGMSILSQTEAMQKINSVISDTIVPILDLVLTPLLPIIELIEASIQDAIMWLTPIFTAIASAIGSIQLVLVPIHVAVHNIRELVKKITNWKYNPKYLDLQTEMAEAIKQINENISKIETWDHKTADNTSGDYSTYQDLYKRGMLSDSNYLSLIKGTNYSSTISGGGVSLQKSGSTTYLAMNGLTINLPGITNAEQFIEYMERFKNGEVGLASRSIA